MSDRTGKLKLFIVATAMMAVSLTACIKKELEPIKETVEEPAEETERCWQAEMDPWANFTEFTYFDGGNQKTVEIYWENHGGDDTTPYPNADVPLSDNVLSFPMPTSTIGNGTFSVYTWPDYEERKSGEEIVDKPVFDVLVDGDVYDITTHEYYFDDFSVGKRLNQLYHNGSSEIPFFEIFAQEIDSDVNVHVLYGKDSVVISADKPVNVEFKIDDKSKNEMFTQNITISEEPVTVVKTETGYEIR